MPNLRDEFFAATFAHYEGMFAGGQLANNKFRVEESLNRNGQPDPHALLRARIVSRMSHQIRWGSLRHPDRKTDFILPVPDGAVWLGRMVARSLGIVCIETQRSPEDRNIFQLARPYTAEELDGLIRGVAVEDVFNRFTNTRRTMAIDELGSRVVAAQAIIDRGDPSIRVALEVPHYALITEQVPDMLPADSPLWRLAS